MKKSSVKKGKSRKSSPKRDGNSVRVRGNQRRKPREASREIEGLKKIRRSQRKNGNKEKKKKKKMKEENRILKSIQLDSVPTKETMDQLYCIRHAVYRGLTDCARNLISENLIDTGKYNCSC